METRRLSFMKSFARHFSSLIIASRIAMMKQMLRVHVMAVKYSLNLHFGFTRRT